MYNLKDIKIVLTFQTFFLFTLIHWICISNYYNLFLVQFTFACRLQYFCFDSFYFWFSFKIWYLSIKSSFNKKLHRNTVSFFIPLLLNLTRCSNSYIFKLNMPNPHNMTSSRNNVIIYSYLLFDYISWEWRISIDKHENW